jgi:hypothetical protein
MRFHALAPLVVVVMTCHATSGSVTGASRFLIGLMTRFATDEGIPAGEVDQDGEGAVIDHAIARQGSAERAREPAWTSS